MSSPRYEGWLLAGRYRLLAGLGRGGTATVWRAHDDLLDREVAVKEVEVPGHLAGPEREILLERTMREARLAARLSHPNIAAVYDVVRADDSLWIVLQLVRSRNLAEVVAEEGPLPAPTLARVGLEVLSALEAAHAAGVMHRDVKPANILLTDEGHAILTDFGLAAAVDEDVSLTRTGMVVGTPAYIAPERAGGAASSAESDLWSFGATLYAAAEGRAAFGRSTALATLAAVLTADPEPFQHAGPLAPVIAGLLDKDPARRTDIVRARRQLEEVVTLSERGADSTAAPFLVTRVAVPAADRSPTGPTEASRRSTGNRFRDRAGFVPIRQRMTGRRRLSVGVAALAVGILTGTIVAGGWRGDEPGRSERDAPSGAAPVTTSQPTRSPEARQQPTRTPEARQVTDERRSTSASRRGGRTDVAPRTTATGSPGPGASGTSARETNPNSNKYKDKGKGKKYGVTQHGNGKKD
ncbi:serine/threonine-protein kinase [Streptosporangium sp. G11]|uniref:serine/threonine-protein kinase n=1 Tax=Streptosporangium sp. G11 TaxID=3436926 RepID=UPI003EBF6B0A